jgi:hypothetical protein
MIKYFCDRCGKEPKERASIIPIYAYDGLGNKIVSFYGKHLCEECSAKLDEIKDQLKYEEDIFDMTDEDIELLRCTFKVGGQVITSTGEVGTITSICTCDRCKERGFFEPEVETEIGNSTIWITDNDKRVGFRSFYKIGNRTFGNIDEDCVVRSIANTNSRIIELEEDLKQYNMQLDIIEHIKNGKRPWWED